MIRPLSTFVAHLESWSQGRRGHETDPAWTSRRQLLTAHERLWPETFARMWNSLIGTGDAGV
jgi:hypothetical protein